MGLPYSPETWLSSLEAHGGAEVDQEEEVTSVLGDEEDSLSSEVPDLMGPSSRELWLRNRSRGSDSGQVVEREPDFSRDLPTCVSLKVGVTRAPSSDWD